MHQNGSSLQHFLLLTLLFIAPYELVSKNIQPLGRYVNKKLFKTQYFSRIVTDVTNYLDFYTYAQLHLEHKKNFILHFFIRAHNF